MDPLRCIFMGSDAIALPMLDNLLQEHADSVQITGVYTQPDRPHGRGMKLVPNAIKTWALEHELPVRQPDKITDEELDWMRGQGCDLLLVMAYGKLLKQSLIDLPRLPPLNLHASLLPKLRGASPIETAIATGEAETGVALMRIVKALDAGGVMDIERVDILPHETRLDLHKKLAAACVPLMQRAIPRLLAGDIHFTEQDPEQVTYCRIIKKDDGAMDFRASAQELHDRCRAFQPWPGAFFDHEGTRIKVGRTAVSIRPPINGTNPGVVLPSEGSEEGLAVQCGNGVLLLLELQRPGGKILPFKDFLRGYPLEPGAVLEGGEHLPLVGRTPRFLP